jgi:hypothetical protein
VAVVVGALCGCGSGARPAKPADRIFPASFLARLPLDGGGHDDRGERPELLGPEPSLPADRGMIAGIVRDEAGRPVAGIDVELRATDLPAAVHTTTAPDGSYEFRDVPPGTADVSVIQGEHGWGRGLVVRGGVRSWVYITLSKDDGPIPIQQARTSAP